MSINDRRKTITSGYVYLVKCMTSGMFYIGSSSVFEQLETYMGSSHNWFMHMYDNKHNVIKCVLEIYPNCTIRELRSTYEVEHCNKFVEQFGRNLLHNDGFGDHNGVICRNNQSVAQIKCNANPEVRLNKSVGLLDYFKKPGSREKASLSHLGFKDSEETRNRKSICNSGPRNPMFGRTGVNNPKFGVKYGLSKLAKSINIYGITFLTCLQAGYILGMPRSTIQRRCKSNEDKYNMYIYTIE